MITHWYFMCMCVKISMLVCWIRCHIITPTSPMNFLRSSSINSTSSVHLVCSSMEGFRNCANVQMRAYSFMTTVPLTVLVVYSYFYMLLRYLMRVKIRVHIYVKLLVVIVIVKFIVEHRNPSNFTCVRSLARTYVCCCGIRNFATFTFSSDPAQVLSLCQALCSIREQILLIETAVRKVCIVDS